MLDAALQFFDKVDNCFDNASATACEVNSPSTLPVILCLEKDRKRYWYSHVSHGNGVPQKPTTG